MVVLLHACCGPCASACEPRLKEEGHTVVLFFSNCNIDTREEFERRLDAARRLGEADGVEVVADEYDHSDWLEKVVFAAGEDATWSAGAKDCGGSAAAVPEFLKIDFKKRDGFLLSLKRSAELGLYRQSYCGCEFSRHAAPPGKNCG